MQNTVSEKDQDIFTIEINDISSIVIENSDKRKNSLFKNVYEDVFDTLGKEIGNIENPHSIDECPNNIFAFIGERGTGKTSCMKSVAKMLSEGKEKLFEERKFEVIESTDPSFFDENKNILEIFLGRLFSKFEKELKSNGVHKTDEKNKVLQNFEEVKNSLACMDKKGVCEDSSVDQLIDLSASVELQKNIHDLISNYLKYVEKDFLVIPIDDIDLHTAHAYEMAEQLRKYLIQPKTIILMALKIEQMESVIEQHYLSLYKDMLNREMLQNSNISDMATRYLIKLIPQSHRFPLKSVEEILNEPINITLNGKKQPFKDNIFKYIITELIFEKTRFLFYNFTNEPSLIIPRNLRECCFLLAFLMRMEESEKDAPLRKYNQKKFIDYILKNWSRALNSKDQKILQDFYNNSDADHLNKAIIQTLKERMTNLKDSKTFPQHINRIASFNNTPYNISIGDVLVYLNYCESKIFQNYDKSFIFAIKTLYSIKLYDFYNKKTDFNNTNNDLSPTTKKISEIPKYDIFVGGAFISESDKQIDNHFNANRLNYEKITHRIISLNDIKDELKKAVNGNEIVDIDIFNTIEFFALTISRSYSFGNDDSFRTRLDPIYNEIYNEKNIKENPYVWFDIFSIFFNITSIERCYNRIDPDLYETAKKSKDSLLNRIIDICNQEKPYYNGNNEHALLSCSCIRSFDVLEKIRYDLITETISEGDPDDDVICTLCTIFDVCQEFSIKTYDSKYNDEKSLYEINFRFANILYNFLNTLKYEDSFNKIYYNTYQKTQKFLDELEDYKNFKNIKDLQDSFNSTKQEPTISIIKPENFEEKFIYLIKLHIDTLNYKYSKAYIEKDFKEAFNDINFNIKNRQSFEEAYQNFLDEIHQYPVIA